MRHGLFIFLLIAAMVWPRAALVAPAEVIRQCAATGCDCGCCGGPAGEGSACSCCMNEPSPLPGDHRPRPAENRTIGDGIGLPVMSLPGLPSLASSGRTVGIAGPRDPVVLCGASRRAQLCIWRT